MKNIILPLGAIAIIFLAFSNIEPKEIPIIDLTIEPPKELKNPESQYIKGVTHGVGISGLVIGSLASGYGIYKVGNRVYNKRKQAYITYSNLDDYNNIIAEGESGNVDF